MIVTKRSSIKGRLQGEVITESPNSEADWYAGGVPLRCYTESSIKRRKIPAENQIVSKQVLECSIFIFSGAPYYLPGFQYKFKAFGCCASKKPLHRK